MFPLSPEIPDYLKPSFWLGGLMVFVFAVIFVYQPSSEFALENFFRTYAPSSDNFSLFKIFAANFLHANVIHLIGNSIFAFLCARLLLSFLSVVEVVALFILGGMIGVTGSLVFYAFSDPHVVHVGASAGILAMMGAYAVFNFRFRSRYVYFNYIILDTVSLPTSYLFAIDAILVDLLLAIGGSSGVVFSNVDSWGHVFGFVAGVVLAMWYRYLLGGWPDFIQTRTEFELWRELTLENRPPTNEVLFQLLEVNPYNDVIKRMLLERTIDADGQNAAAIFPLLTPSFVRHHADLTAYFLSVCRATQQEIPDSWLVSMPYDLILILAQKLVEDVGEVEGTTHLLRQFTRVMIPSSEMHEQVSLLTRDVERLQTARLGLR